MNQKTAFLFCILFASFFQKAAAQDKDTIRIGIFIESLYDLKFADYSFNTNFWMWSIVKGDVDGDGKIDGTDSIASLTRINLIALSNAKEYTYSHQVAYRTETNGQTVWWATQFCKANIYQKWNLDNYPFDGQPVTLNFENTAYDTTQAIMVNVQDTLAFKNDINLIGWTIKHSNIKSSIVKYNTDFGDPNGNGTSFYSRVVFCIDLDRVSPVAYFMNLSLGVFVAFLVALLAFLIGPPYLDGRLGLGVGALFAVAANKYVVDSSIPENAINCLIDKIHEITFVYILFTLTCSALALFLHKIGKEELRIKIDWIAGVFTITSYIAFLTYFGLMAGKGH